MFLSDLGPANPKYTSDHAMVEASETTKVFSIKFHVSQPHRRAFRGPDVYTWYLRWHPHLCWWKNILCIPLKILLFILTSILESLFNNRVIIKPKYLKLFVKWIPELSWSIRSLDNSFWLLLPLGMQQRTFLQILIWKHLTLEASWIQILRSDCLECQQHHIVHFCFETQKKLSSA